MGESARRQIVLLTIILILSLIIRYFNAAYNNVVTKFEQDITRMAYDVQLYLNGRHTALQTLAADPEILTAALDLRQQPRLLSFKQNFSFNELVIFDHTGSCVASTDPSHPHYAADEHSLSQTLQGYSTVSDRITRRNLTFVSIRAPIFHNGEPNYVLSAGIPHDQFAPLLQRTTSAGQYFFLVDGHAQYISHPLFHNINNLEANTAKLLPNFFRNNAGSFRSSDNQDHIEKLYVYTGIANTAWRLVLVQPMQNVYAAVFRETARDILIVLLALLSAGWIYRVSRRAAQYQRGIELLRLERLSCVNQLAAGIAHEIRNPLTSIKGFIQLIARKPDRPATPHHLAIILEEINRIDQLINEFRLLAKPVQEPNHTKVDLVKMLDDINTLMKGQAINNKVKIVFDPPSQCLVTGDIPQLKQVWLNLLRNAIEAMPDGGMVTVAIAVNDDQAVVTITDTGAGIPANILPKLGSPFFTTKKGGTGLGLSVCYNIIHQHGGQIKITSEPGHGTIIAVHLPLAAD